MKCTATIPFSVIDPENDDDELEATFDFTPGQGPSGEYGPPENYDPGSGDEFEDLSFTYRGAPYSVGPDDEGLVIIWLAKHWEPPEPDYPEPDYS